MGAAKDYMAQMEALESQALGLLCDAKVIEECDFHGGTYTDKSGDLESAYKLANYRITNGVIQLPSGVSRVDFTDAIKAAYENNVSEECYGCAKHRYE